MSTVAPKGLVLKSGYLHLEVGGRYVKQWVELTQSALTFYEEKPKSSFFFSDKIYEINGKIVIDYHTHVISSTAVSSSGQGFSLHRDGTCYKFMAETVVDMKDWIDMIEEVINEEEVDSRLSGGIGGTVGGSIGDSIGGNTMPIVTTPQAQPAEPIDTPAARSTYKSYLKGALEIQESSTGLGQWKERYFILSLEALTYYKSSSTTTNTSDRKGSLVICQTTEIHIEDDDEDYKHNNAFIFRIENNGHSTLLAAATEKNRLQWIDSIHSVKKMNMCRWEGDLETMWKWESHLQPTMSVEEMPKDPKFKLRSASIFGFRPRKNSKDDDSGNDLLPSVKNIVPRGLNAVFDSLESGAQGTVAGISSGVKLTASGLSKGLDHIDSGRRLVQGTIVDGTDSLTQSIRGGLSAFGDHQEDFEARSDSFCEYMEDEENEDVDEAGADDIHNTWKTTVTKNITNDLRVKLNAIATSCMVLSLLMGLFMAHSIIVDVGYFIMALECWIMGMVFYLSYQHILGYLVGMFVRYKLTKSVHGDGTKFNLHFEAIKVSVGMDFCELEVRGLRWYNPENYQDSYGKYFLTVKSIRVTVPTMSLYRVTIDRRKVLKIDQVFIDSPLVTLAQKGKGSKMTYNVTSAVGQKDEAVGEDTVPPPLEPVPDASNVKDKEELPFCFDLNSFVLLDMKVRLRNVFKVKSTDLIVPHVVMTRHELTASPRLAHRLPLPIPQLASIIVKEVGSELVSENKVAMLSILSSSGARHLMALFDPRNLAKLLS